MNNEQQVATFEGYAIVEIMGHQKATGYVTTQYFGGTAIFRVVQQEHPAEDITLADDQWIDGQRLYAGSKIRISRPRAETYVAAASLYRITPCTEAEANNLQDKLVEVIERAERKLLDNAAAAPAADIFTSDSHEYDQDHDEDEF